MTDKRKIASIAVHVYDDDTIELKASYLPKYEDNMAKLLSTMTTGQLPLAIMQYLQEKATTKQKMKSLENVAKKFQEINVNIMSEIQKQQKASRPLVGPREVFLDMVSKKRKKNG